MIFGIVLVIIRQSWLRWTMGVAFVIALALPALGLLVGQQG